MLTSLLLLTFRYISVLLEEVAIMTEAYHLRAPGQKGIHVSAWGSFLGQLLLREYGQSRKLFTRVWSFADSMASFIMQKEKRQIKLRGPALVYVRRS